MVRIIAIVIVLLGFIKTLKSWVDIYRMRDYNDNEAREKVEQAIEWLFGLGIAIMAFFIAIIIAILVLLINIIFF